jgi:hypothetical protein
MTNYASLLFGGKAKKSSMKGKKEECPSSSSSESEEEEMIGAGKKKKGVKGMSYEERCKNLEKARATRMANLKNKKAVSGKGQYNQDYVNESQVNYMGSPLDIYYNIPKKDINEIKAERGENVGNGVKRKAKGKMTTDKLEEMAINGGKMGKNGYEVKGGDMSFMKGSIHAGMDMPTKEEFIKGGKMHSSKKHEEYQLDVPEAIKHLGMLANKFGLRLIK